MTKPAENEIMKGTILKPSEIKPGQILYVNMTFVSVKTRKKIIVKEQIIAKEYNGDFQTIFKKDESKDKVKLEKWGIKEDITMTELEVLVDLGMKNPPNLQKEL